MRQTTSVAYRRWAASAWDAAGNDRLFAEPPVDPVANMLIPEDEGTGALFLEGLPPSCDILAGLCDYLETGEFDARSWDDLSGADEPDWRLDVPAFDSLESFAGFEGFDPAPGAVEESEGSSSLRDETATLHDSVLSG